MKCGGGVKFGDFELDLTGNEFALEIWGVLVRVARERARRRTVLLFARQREGVS